MIDEKKLIEEITNLYNEYANDQIRFEREETKAIYRFIGALTYRLENMPKVNEWIPVEERLPEENGYYIVTAPSCINEEMTTMELYFDDGKWLINEGDEIFYYEKSIIAWMPLPKPYEKEVKE